MKLYLVMGLDIWTVHQHFSKANGHIYTNARILNKFIV